jgi:hypothetical protein
MPEALVGLAFFPGSTAIDRRYFIPMRVFSIRLGPVKFTSGIHIGNQLFSQCWRCLAVELIQTNTPGGFQFTFTEPLAFTGRNIGGQHISLAPSRFGAKGKALLHLLIDKTQMYNLYCKIGI